ncbi:MAG: ATP-binding domain-containing protein [Clostridia bacterium]|nr:ATP-binding domain-containing protein [Clostridia bacterium]
MENKNYEQEKQRLDYVIDYIDRTLFSEGPNEANLRQYIIEERRRIWDDYSINPDNVEWMQANQTLEMDTEQYFRIKDKLHFLQQMRSSPYFARIDFKEEGFDEPESFYIGSLSLIDNRTYDVLICDWRADIASLFYDATIGPAQYKCQEGTIRGDISLRRQIKIEDAELKYVFDNGINITDPILMAELGRSSDAKLKTVINTIQREQNQVIRDLNADLLLVQGSAGSGKTSVALHRIAFLLYRFRDSMSSQDIIIFSPSEVFSAYIAQVLPELGEENAVRSDFYHFFADMESELHYADRSEQIEALLKSNDPFLREMIAKKGSKTFAEELAEYYRKRSESFRITQDVTCFDEVLATPEEINRWFFEDYFDYAPAQRVGKIITRLQDAAEDLKTEICHTFLDEATQHGIIAYTEEEKAEQCREMWESCMAEISHKATDLLLLSEKRVYLDFLKENYPEYYNYSNGLFEQNIVPYEDLFCLSWLKFLAGTIPPMRTVKQVVVDEAQEYPEIVYLLLSGIFPTARFTILGDIAQQVDQKVPSVHSIGACFSDKKSVSSFVLNKSYRSTHEINAFADKFRRGEADVRMMERHGTQPQILPFTDPVAQIKETIAGYHAQGHKTNMILCRTQRECDELYKKLLHEIPVIRMRSFDSFLPGTTVILPIYLSKGLEADGVIVAGVSDDWNTEEDRNLMYVAATRALHELTVFTTGEPKLLK